MGHGRNLSVFVGLTKIGKGESMVYFFQDLWERQRPLCYLAISVCVLLFTIAYLFFSTWGLITIHANHQPLDKVIKSIEWQGWVKIVTNMDPATPVTMDCDQVPLQEAMEDLAVNSDCRWRLGWFIGLNHTMVLQGEELFKKGGDLKDGGWVSFPQNGRGGGFVPVRISGDDDAVANPYAQTWNVTDKADDLQGYLQASADAAEISLFAPESLNPKMSSPGVYPNWSISSAIPGLIKQSGNTYEQVLVLQGRPHSQNPPDGDRQSRRPGDTGGGGFSAGGGFDPKLFVDRILKNPAWKRAGNLINGLTPEQAEEARKRLADEQAFLEALRNLSPDDMKKALAQHMADQRGSGPSPRNNPERRAQFYSHMVATKAAALGTGGSAGGGGGAGGAGATASTGGGAGTHH